MPKILIVDDEAYVSTQLEERLTRTGYTVAGIASSGKAAIDMAGSLAPDLILMDIVMPGKIDGIKAAKKIRDELDIPVIFLSAYVDNKLIQKAKLAEPFGYLIKPFNEREIKAAIEVALYKKDMEKRLRESEARYRKVFENTGTATLIIEENMMISMTNSEFEKLSGYSKKEMEGKMRWADFVVEEDLERMKGYHVKRREDEESAPTEYEFRMIDRHGKIRDISLKIGIIPGTKMGVASLRDLTERKLLESQLQQAQKMEAIGTLAGGIAHDFNNILQALSGYCQLLLMKKGEDDPDRNYLNQIDGSIQRAAELVQKLLIFSRKVEGKLGPMNINQEVVLVHGLLRETIPRMVDIKLHLADNLKTINADPIQLEQIIMNLAVNARDAMPDGGKLVVETENVVLAEEYCNVHLGVTPGEYVLLSISDTGGGMEGGILEHIFDPFYTTKAESKGTGLGLAIVYGIVKNHGGYIMCYSEPGEGTTFRVYFPALEAGVVGKAPESEDVEELQGGDETILLVDDEEPILDISSSMLGRHGYTTIKAGNGEDAIEIYKREKDRIDLVILDVGMPGMGGHKCLRGLLEINPAIRVIIASGYLASGKTGEAMETGAADLINKPYQLIDLLKKVRVVLDKEDD